MVGRISGLFSVLALASAFLYLFVWLHLSVSSFYSIEQSEVAGPAGRILRSEPIPGAPAGAEAHRILYTSADATGAPAAVSGVIVIPSSPAPEGGRPVHAWAHPTSGIADRCAPSVNPDIFEKIKGLKGFLSQGMVVVATDYTGLGTPGPHPYLVGESAGRAILDSVRAARRFKGAVAGNRFGMWGYSQGGHGVLFAEAMQQSYAPELDLVAVAATAPPTRLGELMRDDLANLVKPHPGWTKGAMPELLKLFSEVQDKLLTAYVLASWKSVYGAPMQTVVLPSADHVVDRLAARCAESDLQNILIALTSQLEIDHFLHIRDFSTDPWADLIAENTPTSRLPRIPLLITQGTADETVQPEITAEFARTVCEGTTPVTFQWLEGVDHPSAGTASTDAVVSWMGDRFAGKPPPNMCESLPPSPK